jgi:retron-type reverse transcriptase
MADLADLERNLTDLHARVQRGAYRALPSRRTYIPKADGRQRPLAVAALEDKIVQRATVAVLNSIYEEEFLGFSYGFRPQRGQHDALDALVVGITRKRVNFILDADVRSFFDEVSQTWLVRFVEHRIGDPRIVRLIQKWLKAGVLEDGVVTVSDKGTGQGSVISPLLANVYLHYVFDLWADRWRRREATGDVIIVRYADDIVVGFEHEADAWRFWDAMQKRFEEFALSLNPDKTRQVRPPCGGPTNSQRARQAGDLQLPGLHLHLRTLALGPVPHQEEIPARSHADKAQGDQAGDAAAQAPADPRARDLAGAGRQGLLCLPRRANQLGVDPRFPSLRGRPVAPLALAAEPQRWHHVATDQADRRRPTPPSQDPSPVAAAALCRQTLEVGAVCPNRARTDLCGGRLATAVPTANAGG